MRSLLLILLTLTLAIPCFAAPSATDRIRKYVRPMSPIDHYDVKPGHPVAYNNAARLEVCSGGGHGFGLDWLLFEPKSDTVRVLSIKFNENCKHYYSKWPPDTPVVETRCGSMKPADYAALLKNIAEVEAVTITAVKMRENPLRPLPVGGWGSSADFWSYVLLQDKGKTLLDSDYAGYEGSHGQLAYAKPSAEVDITEEAISKLDLKEHQLTDAERAWASAKFIRDLPKFQNGGHWWVIERYIMLIGLIGDRSVLPKLREILSLYDPHERSDIHLDTKRIVDNRCVYYAINAITRLLKKDVRGHPVENMDIEKTREQVLKLF